MPITKLQKALILLGRGQEGKSRIGLVLQYLFENACASSTVDYFENNAFALPRAENKLVLFQDDLKKDKLKSTEVFKMMVKRMEELKQLRAADEITQTVFDREVSFIQEAIKSQRIALVEEAKKNFVSTFQKMREIANLLRD